MKRTTFHWALRSAALSVLMNTAMPMAQAWAADEVQVLRKAQGSGVAMMPTMTGFQQETLAVTGSLPCKWISKDGRLGPSYGSARYDFLCKGGDFGTISLYLDKGDSSGNGVGKVRLLYRDWQASVNPNAGEAVIAQQFLQHVIGRFVPAAAASGAMDAFWGHKEASWSQDGVKITFGIEKGDDFSVRKLEIKGTGGGLSAPAAVFSGGLSKPKAVVAPVPETQIYIDKSVVPALKPAVPNDAGLTTPPQLPSIPQEPAVVVPAPAGVLPVPGVGATRARQDLIVPATAPAGPETLQPATAAELNTAPAPESKEVPVAPVLSTTLVPATPGMVNKAPTGPVRAPSNFEAYNRAVELTKDTEKKAQIYRVDQAKVTASKPAAAAATTPDVVVPPLKPVATPKIDSSIDAPATNTAEGLALPAAAPAVEDIGQPLNYNGPRSSEARPLPQLKFVPKAVPLTPATDVIQFEDEKSKL